MSILDKIADEYGTPMLVMDGYDDCVVGVVSRFGMTPIFCYDINKVIEKLQKDGMTFEEAQEFHEFNQLGAWMGYGTPCFIQKAEDFSCPD